MFKMRLYSVFTQFLLHSKNILPSPSDSSPFCESILHSELSSPLNLLPSSFFPSIPLPIVHFPMWWMDFRWNDLSCAGEQALTIPQTHSSKGMLARWRTDTPSSPLCGTIEDYADFIQQLCHPSGFWVYLFHCVGRRWAQLPLCLVCKRWWQSALRRLRGSSWGLPVLECDWLVGIVAKRRQLAYPGGWAKK